MKIDMNEWELFSARRNSNNYISRDGKWLLKGSSKDRVLERDELQHEHDITVAALKMGIKTPAVGDVVEMPDGGWGLVYEYIENKKSYSRAVSEYPERLDELMKRFAEEARRFHSTEADPELVPPFREKLRAALDNSELYTGEEKQIIMDKERRLPEKKTCLHGDFQPSNIIEAGGNSYFIDLEMISYGDPLYDIGFLWFVTETMTEELSQKVFHVDIATCIKCWETFAKYYFGSDDMDEIVEKIRPYGYISANLMLMSMPTSGFIKYNREAILDQCRK